jgi:hypothetical protein
MRWASGGWRWASTSTVLARTGRLEVSSVGPHVG